MADTWACSLAFHSVGVEGSLLYVYVQRLITSKAWRNLEDSQLP